jgi:two-component system nitrate/nitrite sensor histidine kinase NarX
MALSQDFYTQITSMLTQVMRDPESPPVLQLQFWPISSPERRLLVEFQKTLVKLSKYYAESEKMKVKDEILLRKAYEAWPEGIIIHDIDTGRIIEANPSACVMHGYTRDELIGSYYTTLIHPDYLGVYNECIRAINYKKVGETTLMHARRDGSSMNAEVVALRFDFQSQRCMQAYIRDLSTFTKEILTERLVQQQINERTNEQATLLEISQTLTSTLSLNPDLILEQIQRIITYTHAWFSTIEENTLVAQAVRGTRLMDDFIPYKIPCDDPETYHYLLNDHQPLIVDDVFGNEPGAIKLRELLKGKFAILLEGIRSIMWVPIAVKDRLSGGIGIAHANPHYFTPRHSYLAMTVANHAAITIENVELYRQAQQFASMKERQRLARSLHDAVNQSLFSANLIAEVLPRAWEKDPIEGKKLLEDLHRLTNGAMAEMRIMMAELRPLGMADLNLEDQVKLLSDAFTGRTNIPVDVRMNFNGNSSLPEEVQIEFFRACQEGLNNIAKHSGASKAEIILQRMNGTVHLCVRDNGCGFDIRQKPRGHYGLSMMEERMKAIGADILIESAPDQGTQLIIYWTPEEKGKLQ